MSKCTRCHGTGEIVTAEGTAWCPCSRGEESHKYVRLHYVSTKLNPSFKDKPVPYEWTNVVDADVAEEWKKRDEERWPEVTVTIEEMR